MEEEKEEKKYLGRIEQKGGATRKRKRDKSRQGKEEEKGAASDANMGVSYI